MSGPPGLNAPLAIAVEGLDLSFDGSSKVLSDVSLHIRQGEFVSLVGPSGCGKTTLLNLAVGLVPHTGKGSIHLAGAVPVQGNPQVGYMLARDSLMPWKTALGNAMFGMQVRGVPRAQAEERARAMLQEVGLAGFENALPKALSHGMRQRVALARTFAMGSSLLLMDEPFGALDAQTRLTMQELLLTVWQKLKPTIIFVTHDIDEAIFLASTIYVMSARPGRIQTKITVPLARPRTVADTASETFAALKLEILNLIRH